MTFEIRVADETDKEKWDSIVDTSEYSTIFHRWDWLKIAEKYSGLTSSPLLVTQGTNIIAIYPLFFMKKMGITIGFSPPSNLFMPYLGPVISGYEEMKQNRREHLLIESQKLIDNYLFEEKKCKIVRIRSSPPFLDSRPFQWCGYSVEPLYTYRIDLKKGSEEVWNQLDRKLRVTIKKQIRDGIIIERGKKEDIEYLHIALERRYSEQGMKTRDHLQYLIELYDTFAPNHFQIWIARLGEEKVGGMMTLCNNKVCSLWVGIPKSSLSDVSGNELVQWEAIRWACENNYSWYEEIDSGVNPRLRHFKSKFNPNLVAWYSCTKYSSLFIKSLYCMMKKLRLNYSKEG